MELASLRPLMNRTLANAEAKVPGPPARTLWREKPGRRPPVTLQPRVDDARQHNPVPAPIHPALSFSS